MRCNTSPLRSWNVTKTDDALVVVYILHVFKSVNCFVFKGATEAGASGVYVVVVDLALCS